MVKVKKVFVCSACAFEAQGWSGQCPNCKAWNTLEETQLFDSKSPSGFGKTHEAAAASIIKLSQVNYSVADRLLTRVQEFDRVLGGGFVQGQVVLIAGDPGVGKSTLLTQIAKSVTALQSGYSVFYVAGEESPGQIKLRAQRLACDSQYFFIISETNVESVIAAIEDNYKQNNVKLIIIDSIQTMYSHDVLGLAGSVSQIRYCCQKLAALAKNLALPLILVGHVTKEGSVAGPKVLEHIVDTVLYLEGDPQHMFRLLRTTKNRFGPVSEVGIFEMRDMGMVEVSNPSEIFLSKDLQNAFGYCPTVVMEGYRPIIFEIQALTAKTAFGYPKRTASGFSVNRLQVLIAVLEKNCKLNLADQDIYVNVAGGFKVSDYACDLAVCLAIASSFKATPLKKGTLAFGECGLLGEIRQVVNSSGREKEAKKLGYKTILTPETSRFIVDVLRKAF